MIPGYFPVKKKKCNESTLFFGNVITGPYGVTSPAYETFTAAKTTVEASYEDFTEPDDSFNVTESPATKIESRTINRFLKNIIGYLRSALLT